MRIVEFFWDDPYEPMMKLTKEEAQALLDASDVRTIDEDDEESILLAEHNPSLMEAYKKLWKIAGRK